MPTAERGKIALLCHALLIGLYQEQIDRMMQVRTFVKMPFGCTGEETQTAISELALIVFLNKPVLLVHDAVIGQHFYSLVSSRVYRFVFGRSDSEKFGKLHPESHRNIGILAHHATLLNRE